MDGTGGDEPFDVEMDVALGAFAVAFVVVLVSLSVGTVWARVDALLLNKSYKSDHLTHCNSIGYPP
ncbi:MAG: hypothetical protein FWC04_08975, partial [Chitinispirillia bacterium]|nr:hypothetical protein [Chitinispirillia bacterium]